MTPDPSTPLQRGWFLSLRFPEPLEAEFRSQYRYAFRTRMQTLWYVWAFTWLVLTAADRFVLPDAPPTLFYLRISVFVVMLGTAIATSFGERLGARLHTVTTISATFVGFLLIAMYSTIPEAVLGPIFWTLAGYCVISTIFATTLHYVQSVIGSAAVVVAFGVYTIGFHDVSLTTGALLTTGIALIFAFSLGTTNTIEQYARETFAANNALERQTAALAEKALELEISEGKARDANRAKSVFLSNMSHELRTPLNAVLGFSQLTEQDPTLSAEGRENLRIIERSGDHLLSLIDDVLAISKIEAGRIVLNEHVFDPSETLKSVIDMIRVRTDVKGLQFLVTIDELPRRVLGDEGKLRQVFVNLLGNAVKFTATGGLGVRAQWDGSALSVEIEDTGEGIDANEIDGLFEAFAQSESGRSSKEGTGLGLAISRSFIRLMGGDIRVSSERNRGTTFTVEVPLQVTDESVVEEDRRRVVRLADGQPSYRVLIVDDMPENRLLLKRVLAPIGVDVREATDGAHAVEVFGEWRPQLVFMDMRMPVMDGYAATERIRALETGDRCRIIALTASAFQHDREKILASGCDDFVTKPFRVATIYEKLAEHLGAVFEYADSIVAVGAGDNASDVETPLAERFADIPAELTSHLRTALEIGDPAAARPSIDRILEMNEGLGLELRKLVRAYRFDDIISAIEGKS